ncbi:uncharacterized protein N7459_007432 [Penicillium hispanicum]|uniref:uncharacterized protein n=1 Tax=Penicillium hispanicum TaxID=1080232 RepID=UPI0025422F71|nr:uncharacterized protein N7459_007432 [Penicillium hispanicum]KAJ5578468.1 hypothetical protein N7459_007432 [Penicillium hispanicum]
MCGDSNRPTYGGTIAVLFPRDQHFSSNTSEQSLSSSPNSIASSASSSLSTLSSYSLFFRDPEPDNRNTKAIFRTNDAETYEALRECRQVNMRIEKYGDLTTSTPSTPPLHQFRVDLGQQKGQPSGSPAMDFEIELPERLNLGVSEKGVVGRQITVTEAGGALLGVGVVGIN